VKPIKPESLRLRAEAAADYDVIAACLQDALMPLSEMAFLPKEKRFVAVFDRFMWEHCAPAAANRRPPFTIQTALRVEGVEAARLHEIDQSHAQVLLELLTIIPESGSLLMMFAGGGAIRLEGEKLICVVEDLSVPQPAPVAPHHEDQPEEGDKLP
jgi:hypothetical protein